MAAITRSSPVRAMTPAIRPSKFTELNDHVTRSHRPMATAIHPAVTCRESAMRGLYALIPRGLGNSVMLGAPSLEVSVSNSVQPPALLVDREMLLGPANHTA